jgi:hypothetical protein
MSWDGIKHEEIKARNRKLASGGPKSRVHWTLGDMKQCDWDSIFKKKRSRVETKSK